jgi:hypothetical protein
VILIEREIFIEDLSLGKAASDCVVEDYEIQKTPHRPDVTVSETESEQ